MKKKRILQTVLIASLTLIIGFLAGIFIVGFPPEAYVLPGTIGKADRYRNVKITENDISLRNELLDNSKLQEQYRDYLNYYYIKAVQTSTNLSRLIEVSAGNEDFQPVYMGYEEPLKSYHRFMNAARVDILNALTTVVSLNRDQKMPVIESLNQAGIAISRMRHLDSQLAEFLMVVFDFLHERPDKDYPALANIHDLLAMGIIESAYITQNKPLLKYLDKKPLVNDEEGMDKLIASATQTNALNEFLSNDLQRLSVVASDIDFLQDVVLLMEDQFDWRSSYVIASSLDSEQLLLCSTEELERLGMYNHALQSFISSIHELGHIIDGFDYLGSY